MFKHLKPMGKKCLYLNWIVRLVTRGKTRKGCKQKSTKEVNLMSVALCNHSDSMFAFYFNFMSHRSIR